MSLLAASVVTAAPAPPTPIVELKAATLADGAVSTTTNAGSAAIKFAPLGTVAVETVAGKKAFTFTGTNGLVSVEQTPVELTGKTPWTVAAWIYNPSIASEENFLQWARIAAPNGSGASFGYGNSTSLGAAIHQGGDYPFDRGIPEAGKWHLFVYTYEGTATKIERFYVNGVLNTQRVKAATNEMNITTATTERVNVGTAGRSKFSGSLASVQIWNSVLSNEQIYDLVAAGGLTPPAALEVQNGSFEMPRWGSGLAGNTKVWGGWLDNANFSIHGRNHNYNNGQLPDGDLVASLWDGGTTGIYVPGFVAGKSYKLVFYANAKADSLVPTLDVKFNGTSVTGFPKTVSAVGAANTYTDAFTRHEVDLVTPATPGAWLQFTETTPAPTPAPAAGTTGYAVLLDKVGVYEVGGAAKAVVSVPALDFQGVQNGGSRDLTFTIYNEGGSALSVTGLNFSGADAARFSVVSPAAFPVSVPAYGGKQQVTVRLSANAFKSYEGVLTVAGNGGSPTVALKGVSTEYPLVANGSFEQPTFLGAPNYLGDQLAVPGWTAPASGLGVAYKTGNPHFNNGVPTDGDQVLWIQNNATASVAYNKASQMVSGFHAGKPCKVVLFVNARTQGDNKAAVTVKIGDTQLTSQTVTAVGGINPFQKLVFDFTPAASQAYPLEIGIERTADADSTLLVDKVQVYEIGTPAVPTVKGTTLNIDGVAGSLTTVSLPIYNEGGSDLVVSSLLIDGDFRTFIVTSPAPVTIPPFGGTGQVLVGFRPREAGNYGGAKAQFAFQGFAGTNTIDLTGKAYLYPSVLNGSFESPVQTATWNDTVNRRIDNWTGGSIGMRVEGGYAGNPHVNNGKMPDGQQCGWVQNAGFFRQTLYGFVPGATYHLSFYANARAQADQKAHMQVTLGGKDLFGSATNGLDVTASGAAGTFNEFTKFDTDFVASAIAMELAMGQSGRKQDGTAIDDSTILIDNVQITGGPAPNAVGHWSLFQ